MNVKKIRRTPKGSDKNIFNVRHPDVSFFKLIYYTHNIYRVHKDKLQNCSCNQFHYIGTYKQVETNSVTKNRGGNNGSEK